jgi:hypothetical protein
MYQYMSAFTQRCGSVDSKLLALALLSVLVTSLAFETNGTTKHAATIDNLISSGQSQRRDCMQRRGAQQAINLIAYM